MPCVVFTPSDAPRTKLDAIEAAGARLEASYRNYDAAESAAKDYAASTGGCFISPYTHPDVIAGGGTVALEMIEDQPRLDVVVVPMGGGGLISGIGVALAEIAPACRLVGVEAEASEAFGTARRHGRITEIDPQPTIADGLGGNLEPGAVTFDYVQRHVQRHRRRRRGVDRRRDRRSRRPRAPDRGGRRGGRPGRARVRRNPRHRRPHRRRRR